MHTITYFLTKVEHKTIFTGKLQYFFRHIANNLLLQLRILGRECEGIFLKSEYCSHVDIRNSIYDKLFKVYI